MPAAASAPSANLLPHNMASWAANSSTATRGKSSTFAANSTCRLYGFYAAGLRTDSRMRGGTYHVSRTVPWEALRDCLSPLTRRYKLARGASSSHAVREMATMSLSDWMRQSKAPADVHYMANALRAFFLADPDEISVLPVVEQVAKGSEPSQSEFYRIEGGNDRLVEALRRRSEGR